MEGKNFGGGSTVHLVCVTKYYLVHLPPKINQKIMPERFGYDDASVARDHITVSMEEKGMNPDNLGEMLILGSGLGKFPEGYMNEGQVDSPSGPVIITFQDIYEKLGLKLTGKAVPGHAHKLIIGPLEDADQNALVFAQSGRRHPYEGLSTKEATFFIRALQLFSSQRKEVAHTLIGSNAAGIITPEELQPPALMLVSSHHDLVRTDNPLLGENDDRFGPRFPHNGDLYNAELRNLAEKVATDVLDMDLPVGLYIREPGPNYESAEEIYFLRGLAKMIWDQGREQPGEDRFNGFNGRVTATVGMSSVYEVMVAQHASQSEQHPAFRTGGIGYISTATNYGCGLSAKGPGAFPSHDEVKEYAAKVEEIFGNLVFEWILANRIRVKDKMTA